MANLPTITLDQLINTLQDYPRIIEGGAEKAMKRFWDVRMPMRFAPGNKGKFGFAALTPAYAQWKRGVVGQNPILVLTGELKSAVTAGVVGSDLNVRATLPVYANKVKEKRDFTAVRPTELRDIQLDIVAEFLKALENSPS